jgi:hypothetical protein
MDEMRKQFNYKWLFCTIDAIQLLYEPAIPNPIMSCVSTQSIVRFSNIYNIELLFVVYFPPDIQSNKTMAYAVKISFMLQ